MPEVLTTPTGWLLPAAVLYSRTAIDTGGGVSSSDNRVGLGDVAEFGVATTDQVRERDAGERDRPSGSSRTSPRRSGSASPRTGCSSSQPGVTLGFRKSFERNHDGYKTRIAELTLVASKHLGKRTRDPRRRRVLGRVAAGQRDVAMTIAARVTLHGHGRREADPRVRRHRGAAAAGLEILIDLGWAPEFCYRCAERRDQIGCGPSCRGACATRSPTSCTLESGVRVPGHRQREPARRADLRAGHVHVVGRCAHAVDSLK